jgi:hypothetical protein
MPPSPVANGPPRSYPARRSWVLQSSLLGLVLGAFGAGLWVDPEWVSDLAGVGRVLLASTSAGFSLLWLVYTMSRVLLGAEVTVSADGLHNPWPWLPRRHSIRWADVADITLRLLPYGYAQLVLHLHGGGKSYLPLGPVRSPLELQVDVHQSWAFATGRRLPEELTVWAGPRPAPRRVVLGFYILSAGLGAVVASRAIRLLSCDGSNCRGGEVLGAVVICGALAGLLVCRLVRLRLHRNPEPGDRPSTIWLRDRDQQ